MIRILCLGALLLLMAGTPVLCSGQESAAYPKNGIKLNLAGLTARNISLQYERGLGRHTSLLLGFRAEPKGKVPLKGMLQNKYGGYAYVNDFLENARLSNVALTPEFRYYLGKRPQNGLYLGAYLRYAHFNMTWNYLFDEKDKPLRPIAFTGKGDYTGIGGMIGGQWHIGSHILVDLWLAGVQYGNLKTDLNADVDISDMDSDEKKRMELIITGTSIYGSKLSATVTDHNVRASGTFKGLPGLRTGLCIGFAF